MATPPPSPPPPPAGPGPSATCGPGKSCGTGCNKLINILLIVGGLNWGLIGIGGFLGRNLNVVNILLGGVSALENIVYILVGIAALKTLIKGKC